MVEKRRPMLGYLASLFSFCSGEQVSFWRSGEKTPAGSRTAKWAARERPKGKPRGLLADEIGQTKLAMANGKIMDRDKGKVRERQREGGKREKGKAKGERERLNCSRS